MSEQAIEFIQQLINGLSLGAIYALIALGYTMVFGVLRFINFAHGDVFMIGGYAGWLFFAVPEDESKTGVWASLSRSLAGIPNGIPKLLLVLLMAMVLCAALGIIIEKLCYKPLRERPKITVLITAIGVSLFLESFGQYLFGANPRAFPTVIEDVAIDLPQSWGTFTALTVTTGQVIVLGTTLVLLLVLTLIVLKTKIGMAMRALAFNPTACALMGVNNNFVISFTFGLGSALAGAAGILTSIQQPSIDPLMGIVLGLKAFVAAVFGGIGNLGGAVLGGILLGVVETLVVGYVSPTYRDAVAFAVLILILLVRPAGLLGKNVREKV
ncbi:MAG: branched-chain amino acid ABC transporter permease [Verrucomicrobiota bacterium]|nr:branched-chain amino acid ABC transporter permease [Verrucomicrobiota bacterium]